MRRIVMFFIAYLGFSAVLVALWLFLSYPEHPTSVSGWLLLLVLALPAQIALEFIGEVLWKNKAARFVEDRTASKSFSWIRVAYGLIHIGVILGAVLVVSTWLEHH